MVYRVWGYYEKDVELFITVVTNLAALPSTFLAFHQKRFANFVIILCTMTVSILYHVAEVKADRIWGTHAIFVFTAGLCDAPAALGDEISDV